MDLLAIGTTLRSPYNMTADADAEEKRREEKRPLSFSATLNYYYAIPLLLYFIGPTERNNPDRAKMLGCLVFMDGWIRVYGQFESFKGMHE